MHHNPVDSTVYKENRLKRLASLSRREVYFEPQKRPRSTPSNLSQPVILTSSPCNSLETTDLAVRFAPISADQFYASPKPFLERQYEKHLKKFVPTESQDDFVPLELDSEGRVSAGDESLQENSEMKESGNEEVSFEMQNILNDSNQSMELQIAVLLNASEKFITKAHSLVLACNDMAGTSSYYSDIKLAMKCLFMVIREYSDRISPLLETAIFHKLAVLYLEETASLDQAEKYTVLSISMASRHNLTKLKVMSELLYCRILELSQASSVSSYYSEKRASYLAIGYNSIADLFNWARIDSMLVKDVVTGTRALRTTNLRDDVYPILRFLFLLKEMSLNLYRDASYSSTFLITRAEDLLSKTQHPPQLRAYLNILMLASCAIKHDTIGGKLVLRNMSHFIHNQRKRDWAGWEDDGTILIQIPLSATVAEQIQVRLLWVNHHECSILFYFFSGVLIAPRSESYKETKRIFEKCLGMIGSQMSELTSVSKHRCFTIQHLTKNIVRLTFFRYSVLFYKIYIDIMHKNDFSGMAVIRSFISCFDEDNFTQEEICYYKILIPKFLYLAAFSYHSLGDFHAAKYYYYRVRCLTSLVPIEKGYYLSALQKQMGLGWGAASPVLKSSELHLFSTLHLLALIDREIQARFDYRQDEKSKTIELNKLSGELQADLDRAVRTVEANSHGSLSLVALCYQQLATSMKNNGAQCRSLTGYNHLQISEGGIDGFLKALTAYAMYKKSVDQKERAQIRGDLAKIGSGNDYCTRLVGILVLAEEKLRETTNGNYNRASKIGARIAHLQKNIGGKLEFVNFSLQI